MRKRTVALCLIVLSMMFSLMNIYMQNYSLIPGIITGKGLVGIVSLIVEGDLGYELTVYAPENITYNFNIGDTYLIELNVSANFIVTTWWYSLQDVRNNVYTLENITFEPNTTFTAVRYENVIYISANDSSNNKASTSVNFTVYVPNSAPLISDFPSDIYVCENSYLDYYFNVTDVDEDTCSISSTPAVPFYISFLTNANATTKTYELFSGILRKSRVGTYEEYVSASDGEYSDTKYTNITVIEINNAPTVEAIGVQTIWYRGENSTFEKQWEISDTESGTQNYSNTGNFTFNITFENEESIFEISNNGTMYFTGNSTSIGVYNITICVNDTGLSSPHENISLCSQDGLSITRCDNFSLTVTDENRHPNITGYFPTNFSLEESGTEDMYFNATTYDADGNYPDLKWYLDNTTLIETDTGSLKNELVYQFGCDVSGEHQIQAIATDGVYEDSIEWNVTVRLVDCPSAGGVSGGGGGGGAGEEKCFERWACEEWGNCQNAKKSLELREISSEDYIWIRDICRNYDYDEAYCGYQTKTCIDLNACNNTFYNRAKPEEIQACIYTENPTCNDGITNCHDGACEVLVDCGGPCPACPSCSDGMKNQGEQGIDCGGPCPYKCEVEKPLRTSWMMYLLIPLLLILLIFIIRKIYIIFILKRKKKKEKDEIYK